LSISSAACITANQSGKRRPKSANRRLRSRRACWRTCGAGIVAEYFVEYNGKPVLSVKKAFRKVVQLCELDLSEGNITPHTLRHTAATWLMQARVSPWVAAGYLGMTLETLERTYGHHHPDFLAEAVEGISRKKKQVDAA
jgi:integrase